MPDATPASPPDAPSSAVDAGSPVVPAADETPRPATWTEREPTSPWCPEPIAPFVPELRTVVPPDAVSRVDLGTTGWRVIGASRRGRIHAHKGQHREDAMAQATWANGWAVAVADGAGSATFSRIGAELAVRTVVDTVLAAVVVGAAREAAPLLEQAMHAGIARVARLASEGAIDPRQLRCTLLAAARLQVARRDVIVCAQVGDGVVATVDVTGRVTRVGTGDAGEYSGEVACFVPDACAMTRASASVVVLDAASIVHVLVASDGVEDPFYPIERTGGRLLDQLLHGVREPLPGFQRQDAQPAVLTARDPGAALLDWLRYEKRGENDDRTLVVAHRTPLPTREG
jgi:hypothetical protein